MNNAAKPPAGKVFLYPETVGVNSGDKIVLEAANNPFGRKGDWLYQWQTITGQEEDGELIATNLPGANSPEFIKVATTNDAKLYRCMIYRGGDCPDTKYTTVISLHVTAQSRILAGVITTVSGSFKPGGAPAGSSTLCRCTYKDGLVFQSPAGNWWNSPANASPTAVITDNTTGVDYSKTPVYLQVSQGFTPIKCWKLPQSSMSFPAVPNQGYMFTLYFPGPLPPTSTKFSFSVKW